ncbi:MAG TPA: AlkA N-terminal domain-containing protein [Trueperaceae bacterium]|nr:AlkA N-terminal domain-containing protein [Trueperaceae bacterium]
MGPVIPLKLSFQEPYHAGAMLAALAAHAVHGLELTDLAARNHSRAVRTPSGPAVVTVSFDAGQVSVIAKPPVEDKVWLAAMVRRWLDLDADPTAVAAALAQDPVVGPLLAIRPGLRVLGYADAFEGAVMTVLGQQVSLAATRTFGGRLLAAYGTPVLDGFSVYPTAEVLASITPDELQRVVGVTGSRARTVVSLAAAFAAGLSLEPTVELREVRDALLAIPGIGPWTVDYLSVRALGDHDGFVPGDLVLRRALGVDSPKQAAAMAEAWRPYRAYALFHLWTSATYL